MQKKEDEQRMGSNRWETPLEISSTSTFEYQKATLNVVLKSKLLRDLMRTSKVISVYKD